jgi:hypothetical protein
VICDTDAIVHPLAMVVEALNALIANIAMAGVGRAYHLAVGTEQVGFKLLYQTHKRDVRSAAHVARLHFHSQNEEDHCPQEDHEKDWEPAVRVDVYRLTSQNRQNNLQGYTKIMLATKVPSIRNKKSATVLLLLSILTMGWRKWQQGRIKVGFLSSWSSSSLVSLSSKDSTRSIGFNPLFSTASRSAPLISSSFIDLVVVKRAEYLTAKWSGV